MSFEYNVLYYSYNLFKIYQSSSRCLIHLDAYRLEKGADFDNLMIDDFLNDPWCLAIEWPEKISSYLPSNLYRLILKIADDGKTRQACLVADEKILKALESFTN